MFNQDSTPIWSLQDSTPLHLLADAEIIDILEKVHVKFCKLLLNLKTSTPIYIYIWRNWYIPSEYTYVTVKLKFLSFWPKLIDGKQSKLSSLIYKLFVFEKIEISSIVHCCFSINQNELKTKHH